MESVNALRLRISFTEESVGWGGETSDGSWALSLGLDCPRFRDLGREGEGPHSG